MRPAVIPPDLDSTRALLVKAGLNHAAGLLGDHLEEGVKERRSPHEILQRLLLHELELREERRIAVCLRKSGLPPGKTLDGFDFSFQPSVDRRRIEFFATGEYLANRENILLLGPPGVGKTHLAAGLAVKAIARGYGAYFMTLDDLIRALRQDANASQSVRQSRAYHRASLLIVDEVGYTPLDRREANLFFRLINNRYERCSTIITSNLGPTSWAPVFAGDEALTAAICDRLLHRGGVINIKGRSYRLKDYENAIRALDAQSSTVAPVEA